MGKKDHERSQKGVTRRGFLRLMGVGAMASTATPGFGAEPSAKVIEPAEMTKVEEELSKIARA